MAWVRFFVALCLLAAVILYMIWKNGRRKE